MLCPLLNIKWKGEFVEYQEPSYIRGFGECQKEKCAWWSKGDVVVKQAVRDDGSTYKYEEKQRDGCAIKIIAEK